MLTLGLAREQSAAMERVSMAPNSRERDQLRQVL